MLDRMLNKAILILFGIVAFVGVATLATLIFKRKPIYQPLIIELDGTFQFSKELPGVSVTNFANVTFDVKPSKGTGGMILNTPSGGNISSFKSPQISVFLDPAIKTPTLIQNVSSDNINKIPSTIDIVTDGKYHTISVYLKDTVMNFEVDGKEMGTLANLGGWGPSNLVFGEDGFSGTIRNIYVNNTLVTVP